MFLQNWSTKCHDHWLMSVVIIHMRLFRTRHTLCSIQNIKGPATLYPTERTFGCKILPENKPNLTLCFDLWCYTVTLKTSSRISHPILTVNHGNKAVVIWKLWRHRLSNLKLFLSPRPHPSGLWRWSPWWVRWRHAPQPPPRSCRRWTSGQGPPWISCHPRCLSW